MRRLRQPNGSFCISGSLAELLRFDGIAAVSEDSRTSLLEYWRWLGASRTPPVQVIPLGIKPHPFSQIGGNSPGGALPIVLCVGSLEGRKNHVTLLDACKEIERSMRDLH